jgi:carotenoid cleavage dioxygenase-like enzyme
MPASPFLTGNYAPVHDELTVRRLPLSGRLPPGLRGTLYRNGANPRFTPPAPYHWFTGDGMVHAVTIGEDGASYRNRWVRTPRFHAETEAGRPLFAGFGRPLPGTPEDLDNGVANTHVLAHAGRLLALEEAHLPTRLAPHDLSTVGYDDFGGALTGRFTAHPKRDPHTGQLVFFSYSASGPFSSGMSWGEIEADGRVSRREMFEAPYCSMVHDFAVTARHAVFPVLPLTGSLERAMSGLPPFAWEPGRPGALGVLRRDGGAATLAWTEIEPRFAFHVMNAFDAEDGTVAMDVIEYDVAPLFPRADGSPSPPEAARSRLCRWRVDPAGRAALRREVLDEQPGEFPRVDERRAGLPYRHGFRVGQVGERDAILHHDLARGIRHDLRLTPGERVSEAVFAPASADAPEGEGWLLAIVWRPETEASEVWIVDAQRVAEGPVATIPLPRRVPFGFHGSWVAAGDVA